MKLQVVAVKDRALNAFGNPFFVHTLGQAIRSFTDEINRNAPDNAMHAHPDDYDLWHLAIFDNEQGEFQIKEYQPQQIAIGKNCKIT